MEEVRYHRQSRWLEIVSASKAPIISASGWHTSALVMRTMCDAYLLDSASLGSPGVEKIPWLKPVRPGDTLHVRSVVLEARPLESKPYAGLVRSRWEVVNQDNQQVMSLRNFNIASDRL